MEVVAIPATCHLRTEQDQRYDDDQKLIEQTRERERLEHHNVPTNGIALHTAQAGPTAGPLVILLHGFPEFWYSWKNQIEPLAEAGMRVWAPDQRGYNLSVKPKGVRSYNLDTLAQDIIGLIDASGNTKATIVGHDWGAAVTWWLATRYPERIERVAILNVPHPAIMAKTLRSNAAQRKKSGYIFFFQVPGVPEWIIRRDNFAQGVRSLLGSSRKGTFSETDLAQYRTAWSQPGALTGMLNWYRAALRYAPPTPKPLRIHVPTLVIWGKQDRFLEPEMAQASVDLCDDGRLVYIDEASHWVQHEEPARVNALLLDFIRNGNHGGDAQS